jgi:hypothetical protein
MNEKLRRKTRYFSHRMIPWMLAYQKTEAVPSSSPVGAS